MNVTEKVKWGHLVFIFPSYVMVLKLPKKVFFFAICTDLSKKPKSVKEIYMNAS